ncbi:hypothetical protein MTO96_035907 [Rhipicephalus appendiculatus]
MATASNARPADNKDKNDEKDEINNDRYAVKARETDCADTNTDDKDEPEVNNTEKKETTDRQQGGCHDDSRYERVC